MPMQLLRHVFWIAAALFGFASWLANEGSLGQLALALVAVGLLALAVSIALGWMRPR